MKDVTHVQICLLDFIIIFVEKLMNASYLWFKTIKQFKLKLLHTNYLSNLHSFSRNLGIFSEKIIYFRISQNLIITPKNKT